MTTPRGVPSITASTCSIPAEDRAHPGESLVCPSAAATLCLDLQDADMVMLVHQGTQPRRSIGVRPIVEDEQFVVRVVGVGDNGSETRLMNRNSGVGNNDDARERVRDWVSGVRGYLTRFPGSDIERTDRVVA